MTGEPSRWQQLVLRHRALYVVLVVFVLGLSVLVDYSWGGDVNWFAPAAIVAVIVLTSGMYGVPAERRR